MHLNTNECFFFQEEKMILEIMKLTQKLTQRPDVEFRWSLESHYQPQLFPWLLKLFIWQWGVYRM